VRVQRERLTSEVAQSEHRSSLEHAFALLHCWNTSAG
jgi:hypothetical protein